jgi:membrane associated rhomboid family serine protease
LPIYIMSVALPAWVMLGYWSRVAAPERARQSQRDREGQRRVLAHVGGFIAGLVLVRLFASEEVLRRRPTQPAPYYRYRTFG